MIDELFHGAAFNVVETTYFGDSFMNGAPGSSAAVRGDHAGSNIVYVLRPRRIASQPPIRAPIAVPIFGSKSKSKVQRGSSLTPSRVMNSCTTILPICLPPPRFASACVNPTDDRGRPNQSVSSAAAVRPFLRSAGPAVAHRAPVEPAPQGAAPLRRAQPD